MIVTITAAWLVRQSCSTAGIYTRVRGELTRPDIMVNLLEMKVYWSYHHQRRYRRKHAGNRVRCRLHLPLRLWHLLFLTPMD